MEEETAIEPAVNLGANTFAEDIARYFQAFLETSLQGTLEPTRRTQNYRIHGLKTSLYLDKYSQLNKNIYKNITSGFAQETFVITQNKYATHIDERLSDLLARAAENINSDQANTLAEIIARSIDKAKLENTEGYDVYATKALLSVRELFASELVVPILREIYTTLTGAVNENLPLQIEATEKVFGSFRDTFVTIISAHFHGDQTFDELHTIVRRAIDETALKLVLRELLDELSVIDAYQEIYELHRNNNALGSTTSYLYFCQIAIGEASFPLFYIPTSSSHAYPSVTLTFEPRIFINTKALQFVLKVYNATLGLNETLPDNIEPILYIDNQNRKQTIGRLQAIIDKLGNVFGLEQVPKLDSMNLQASKGLGVRLDNRIQFCVTDISNEAIAHDYEQILQGSPALRTAFSDLVNNYILQTPTRYVEEIAEEWNAKPMTDKLLADNPLPLNEEQKQAMLALGKKGCDVMVVEGPTGTGKSHFASGIVTQSFVSNFTTLVLSDTKAALDDIQQRTIASLNEVREGTAYHNPILRLDTLTDESLEHIEAQFIEKLRSYNEHYSHLQNELRTAKNRKIKDTAETLNGLVQNVENVNLHEVEQTVNNESKFGDRDWIQDEPIEDITADIQRTHQAIQYIRKSEANYLLPYIEHSQQKAIGEFIQIIREYEKASKNVNQRMPEFIVRYRKLLPEQKTRLQSALSYVHSNYRQYIKILNGDSITAPFEITDNTDYRTLAGKEVLFNKLIDLAKDAGRELGHNKAQNARVLDELIRYNTAPEEIVAAVKNYIEQVVSLKSKIFGFSGRTLVVENLTRQLKKSIPEFSIKEPEKRLEDMQLIVDTASFIIEELAQLGLDLSHWKQVLHILKASDSHTKELQKIVSSLVAPADFEFMAAHRIYESDNLLANISLLQHATSLNDVFRANANLSTLFGIKTIGQVLAKPQAFSSRFNKLATDLDDVKQLDECKVIIKRFLKTYPAASKRLGINYVNGNLDIIDDTFAECSTEDLKEYLAFKKKEQDITAYFKDITSDNYARNTRDLRQMTLTQISHSLDEKLIAFIEKHAAEFNEIKTALRTKRSVSAAEFRTLQSAFPCVMADIRDYATFVPLQKQLFDVVIIDEASRVSIAQALPALLRAKKVIIIGDESQYKNRKAEQVHDALNEMFRSRAIASFTTSLQDIPADTKNTYLTRIRENFDVKKSVLAFCRTIANSEQTFTAYFQSSPELISYANKTFYDNSLRCLQARTLPLSESIKLDHASSDSALEPGLHTNLAEAKRIIEALQDMKESGYEGSIGIVTPYYEQAALIQKELDECVIGDWFERRKLKVMTFETCQGETRDYVFYSLVSNDEIDRHQYFLPEMIDAKAQPEVAERLAVGFSCAGSTMHFVLSKPAEQYTGSIKAVLDHYRAKLSSGTKTTGSTTDILLAAESLVPQYFYATKFYKKHTEKARLVTQFSLGDYIKPLAPQYRHPSYKVDFLVSFGNQRIVITYDEFKENFLSSDIGNKDATNYLTPAEIYAQKVLEGYEYTFLRLNRFNLGSKPVERLDALLTEVVKKRSWPRDNGFLPKS